MSFLERIGELTKAVLTTDVELKQQRQMIDETRLDVRRQSESIQQLSKDLQQAVKDVQRDFQAANEQLLREIRSLSDRLTRLESLREGDRAELRAEIARFGAEVERAVLRMERRQLPPGQTENGDE